jgi:hypothetical protein
MFICRLIREAFRASLCSLYFSDIGAEISDDFEPHMPTELPFVESLKRRKVVDGYICPE